MCFMDKRKVIQLLNKILNKWQNVLFFKVHYSFQICCHHSWRISVWCLESSWANNFNVVSSHHSVLLAIYRFLLGLFVLVTDQTS